MLSLLLNGFDLRRNLVRQLYEDEITDFVENNIDDILTFLTESSINVSTLDQEHVHSDLEWHLVPDLGDCCLEFVDLILEIFSVVSLLLKVCLNPFLLFQDEKVIVININSQFYDPKVFI